MSQQTHQWETTHDHANRTMKMQFTDDCFLFVNWENLTCKLFRNGEEKSSFCIKTYTIAEFEKFLLYIESTINQEI